jgi:translation initiation factor 2B subunit (eIF-2B alpha/beta/delta family)
LAQYAQGEDNVIMNAVLEERVRELREEHHHGASWMARRALEALVEAVRSGEDPLETARLLASTRSSLGAIAGALGRVLSCADNPDHVIAEAEAVIGSRDRAAKAIAILLGAEMSGTVMTHSASATVREALVHTPPAGVVCTISEPGREGRGLAADLKVEGIAVELISDDERAEAARECDVVLFGADTVFADGSLVNKVGTGTIAQAAAEARVPVIVACETFKLAPFDPEPPTESTFELVPADLISRVVTEEGAAETHDVAALIDRTPCLRHGYDVLRGRRDRIRPLES